MDSAEPRFPFEWAAAAASCFYWFCFWGICMRMSCVFLMGSCLVAGEPPGLGFMAENVRKTQSGSMKTAYFDFFARTLLAIMLGDVKLLTEFLLSLTCGFPVFLRSLEMDWSILLKSRLVTWTETRAQDQCLGGGEGISSLEELLLLFHHEKVRKLTFSKFEVQMWINLHVPVFLPGLYMSSVHYLSSILWQIMLCFRSSLNFHSQIIKWVRHGMSIKYLT